VRKALKGEIPRTLGLETTVQRSWEEETAKRVIKP
jgi:hypothetical protein